MMSDCILALYDFASKQNYIYRTTKVKEISGASSILCNIYDELAKQSGLKNYSENSIDANGNLAIDGTGEVLYVGGGNMMAIYKNEEEYIRANKLMSKYILQNYPTLQMIVAKAKVTGNFEEDRKNLYKNNAERKNLCSHPYIDAVTPISQIDPMTYFPVVVKKTENGAQMSLSADRAVKRKNYVNNDDFDQFNEGLIAVVHIDGNRMGEKLKSITTGNTKYSDGVKSLRNFSSKVQKVFVDDPKKEIEQEYPNCRWVITGGDDITLICKAEEALKIVFKYFEILEKSEKIGNTANHACAGIVIAHAKTPFSMIYSIAEDACDSAKSASRKDGNDYFDFHYCHAGISGDLDAIREKHVNSLSNKPYSVSDAKEKFEKAKIYLNEIGRSNVKSLGENAQKTGEENYKYDIERICGYLKAYKQNPENAINFLRDADNMGLIYDMSEFYDLWFNDEENKV